MFKMNKMDVHVMKLVFHRQQVESQKLQLKPLIRGSIGEKDEHYFTEIGVIIKDDKKDGKKRYPFHLEVTLRAYFDITEVKDQEAVERFLIKQGVHLLYPYVRATVSSLSTTAMVNPLILPILDASQMAKQVMQQLRKDSAKTEPRSS